MAKGDYLQTTTTTKRLGIFSVFVCVCGDCVHTATNTNTTNRLFFAIHKNTIMFAIVVITSATCTVSSAPDALLW